MFLIWFKNGSCNIYEIFMRETRLNHLSNAIGITFLSDLVRELKFLHSRESGTVSVAP
jgi:hypothetical protein